MDKLLLKLPVFGDVIRKATVARWTRTLSTMFAAGVPLVESLDSVARPATRSTSTPRGSRPKSAPAPA
jgi:type IV pilus assembly protein PilC